ncbi:diguanylate cyclase [Leptospira sp. 96542]|nr:diguanylate cyclase [Leptospira sp. 96542]
MVVSGNKILIVEDSELQRRILIRWLTKNGYETIEADSLTGARDIITKDNVDVVLLDWELPDGTGIELITELLSSAPTGWLPIIMVTSHKQPDNIKLAIEAGATDYISKPAEEIELLARIYSSLRIKTLQDQLRETAIRDVLTGLYNRRYINERFEQEFQRCRRHGHECSFAILDIDFFKKVNDTYGHDTGDRVLKILATVLKDALRKSDIIGRFGGEEFVILFPETKLKDSINVLDKIRLAVSELEIVAENDTSFKISFSGGLAGGDISIFNEPAEILKIADKNLYEAKSKGRNCLVG